jgi:gas vesicle structural protein
VSASSNAVVFTGDDPGDEMTLLDILDHVLNQGVVLRGNIIISLAGVDLVYLGLDVILTSVETALKHVNAAALSPQK